MVIKSAIEILSGPEEVFSWIENPNKAKIWQKGVQSEILKETPEKIGTAFTEILEDNGKTLVIYGVIKDYTPNQSISFQLESKMHSVFVNYSVEKKMAKTILSIDSIIKWKFPTNLIFLFIGYKIKKSILAQTNSELNELKILCENRNG
ncbi:MAG: hypothetical protein HC906_20105 [Bacteroidales bacterium]|nr:hypothetical protein [Bacteroidales bacterium]